MRVQLTKEFDGQPAGLLADWPDEKAKAAVDAGAAVPLVRTRFLKDQNIRGRMFPARFEFDLPTLDAAKAVADGAAEYADPAEAERHGRQDASHATRARTPKAEG